MAGLGFLTFLAIHLAFMRNVASDLGCHGDTRMLNFTISFKRNSGGQWLTTTSATKDSEDPKNEMDLSIMRIVTDCGGGRYAVRIYGVLSDNPVDDTYTMLLFHPRAGSNIALTNNRTTAQRISSSYDHGVVYTDRPLKRGELFEIKLDAIDNNYPYNLGIGISSHTPYEMGIPDQKIYSTPGMWLYYHEHFYVNGKRVMEHYGKLLDRNDVFKVGDRIGLRVTHSGILHVLINGEDQGPAANEIPESVHGVVELRSKAMKISIL